MCQKHWNSFTGSATARPMRRIYLARFPGVLCSASRMQFFWGFQLHFSSKRSVWRFIHSCSCTAYWHLLTFSHSVRPAFFLGLSRVMSTPHKLNVTFWDMAEKSNNGYASKITDKNKKSNFLSTKKWHTAAYAGIGCAVCLLTCFLDMTLITSVTLPFMAVAGVHFWHAIIYKGSLSNEMSHGLFCASVLGEVLGGTAVTGFASRTVIHLLVLMLTGIILGHESTLITYACSRLFLWSCLPWFPEALRAILSHVSAISGIIAAKYVESVFISNLVSEIKLTTPRRRRTSNNTLYSIYKIRRTSLPALGGSNKSVHGAFGFQVRHCLLLCG